MKCIYVGFIIAFSARYRRILVLRVKESRRAQNEQHKNASWDFHTMYIRWDFMQCCLAVCLASCNDAITTRKKAFSLKAHSSSERIATARMLFNPNFLARQFLNRHIWNCCFIIFLHLSLTRSSSSEKCMSVIILIIHMLIAAWTRNLWQLELINNWAIFMLSCV